MGLAVGVGLLEGSQHVVVRLRTFWGGENRAGRVGPALTAVS
jgi:hypothetical protein